MSKIYFSIILCLFLISFTSAWNFPSDFIGNKYINATYNNVTGGTYSDGWINSTIDSKILTNNNSVNNYIATIAAGSGITWETAMNGTLFKTSQWNATNTSYALQSILMNGSFFNTAGTDTWIANYSSYYTKTDINNFNASYLNTTNMSYIPYTGANQNVNLGNNNLTVNGTTLFVDTNNGKLAVGTTNPFQKLHVNGSILANGTINATSGFGVNGKSGITGNYTLGNCFQTFTGGIMHATNCTSI